MVKKTSKKSTFDVNKRLSGILLHPTSLPGKYGIGELGSDLFKFIDLLKKNNQKIWQILPLGPTGYGNSPYQCFSAFAGNPFLISVEKLIANELLKEDEISNLPINNVNKVDFGQIIPWKWDILHKAFQNFLSQPQHTFKNNYDVFIEKNESWLHDYALFMAIKNSLNNLAWNEWPQGLRDRESDTLNQWVSDHKDSYEFHKFVQFLFFYQWDLVKKYCSKKGILIIGDIPIFVALDSADVWANRELFYIDSNGKPEVIAGVPPDYFSKTGQRWGNPLYKWPIHQKQHYKWWKERFKQITSLVDLIRLDHFRGFEAYWSIDSAEKTAIKGKWIKGPGSNFFNSLKKDMKELPIIAENLGVITEEVENLRYKFNLPGMKILQFAFDDPYNTKNPYLPHNYDQNNCVYTGTHDNETIVGWFENLTKNQATMLKTYFNQSLSDIASVFIRECMKSVAKYAIFPLQDILRIDNSGRMNFPGKESDNWEWRFDWKQIKTIHFQELKTFTKNYNRV